MNEIIANVAAQIKPITLEEAIKDFVSLSKVYFPPAFQKVETKMKSESRIGNKFIDYFTFTERLNTRTRKGMNFYEFAVDTEYHKRSYIKNLLVYQEHLKVNELTKLYRIYSLHCGSVALFKPLKAMEIYQRFKPNSVLDPTCGWGGRMVGAVVSKVPNYIGIDLNQNLKEPYKNMISTFEKLEANKETNIDLYFCDAVTFDYSKLNYDMIFTSPPYFNIELYSHTNKKTKQEWIDNFYKPLFLKTFEHLLVGGWMCINISKIIYESVFIDLFGKADEIIPMALHRRPKQSQTEFIYCWLKKYNI